MNPYQRLHNQRALIELATKHHYIPQSSSAAFGEILSALKEIDPNTRLESGCSGCVMEIIKTAERHLKNYNPEPQFKTFPKQ
jgi:hypothetical protein